MSDGIDIRTELQLGSWIDVTNDVRTSSDLKITHGRADYAGQPDPCKLALVLNNRHGRYTANNPLSPYYGILGRNAPIRVSVPQADSYLHLVGPVASATTPDAAALDIVGDLDVRVQGQVNWSATRGQILLQKWANAGNQRSWLLGLQNGQLLLQWSTAGATSDHVYSWTIPALPAHACLRATLDVNNGAGGFLVRMYWAPAMSGPWAQFSVDASMTGVGVTSIFSGSAPVTVGAAVGTPAATGQIDRAEVRSGLGGTVVTAPDFTVQAPGATSFTDTAGCVWTVSAPAEISNRNYRFHGEISSLPTEWDASGNDQWVSVSAAGVKRRYQQGTSVLQSALRRSVVRETALLAYWPMEEGEAATQAYSPIPGVAPMATHNLDWAADDTLPASLPLPKLASANNGADPASLRGRVPAPLAPITGWQVRLMYRMDKPNTSLYTVVRVLATGTGNQWLLQISDDTSRVLVLDADGNTVIDQSISTGLDLFGQWNSLFLFAQQDGTLVRWEIGWQDPGGDAGSFASSFTGTIGRPTAVTSPNSGYNPGLDGLALGHIGVFGASLLSGKYNAAWLAYTGETAGARMLRLAAEESRPLEVDAPVGATLAGGPRRGERVGPQLSNTWLALIESAAETDGGILYEDKDALGLRYRDRETLYAQEPALVLDYTVPGHVMPGIKPVDDDQATRNLITITRDKGSSATSIQEAGPLNVADPGTNPDAVGEYEQSATLSLYDDEQTQPIADWRRALGTYPGSRFPTVTFDLRRAPALREAFLRLVPGDRADILNIPVGKGGPDDVRLLAQGYTETLGPYNWRVDLSCTPAAPWSVARWGDDADTLGTTSRWDTDGSILAATVDETAAMVPVRTTQGALWTTDPADLPFDIVVGGERMRVSAIGPSVTDTFARTATSSWGSADSGQAWTITGGTSANYSVSGGLGRHTISTTNAARFSYLDAGYSDVDVSALLAANSSSTGGSQFACLFARYTDTSNHYYGRLEIATTGVMTLSLRSRVAGTDTQLAAATLGFTHFTGRPFGMRIQVIGSTLRARAWDTTVGPEPGVWDLAAADTALTAGTRIGCRSIVATGNTNSSPVITYAAFTDRSQAFTAQRSVNGIIKSHTAGAVVELADPDVWGL